MKCCLPLCLRQFVLRWPYAVDGTLQSNWLTSDSQCPGSLPSHGNHQCSECNWNCQSSWPSSASPRQGPEQRGDTAPVGCQGCGHLTAASQSARRPDRSSPAVPLCRLNNTMLDNIRSVLHQHSSCVTWTIQHWTTSGQSFTNTALVWPEQYYTEQHQVSPLPTQLLCHLNNTTLNNIRSVLHQHNSCVT